MTKELLEEMFGCEFIDAGDNWKAKCPFHGPERTPSFYIHKTSLLTNCFGCGTSGYVDTLVAKKRRIPRSDARSLLDLDIVQYKEIKVERAPKYFPESWLSPWRTLRHHDYLVSRGFNEETTQAFDARYDAQTKRVVFPLREFGTQKLVGAAGRATDTRDPKWYFYWSCAKSNNIFLTEYPIDALFIVEGIFDAMWLWQHGYSATALLGSKPSLLQKMQLRQCTNEFIIALDNDEAGQSGAEELERALKVTGTVKHVVFPPFANDVCDLNKEQLDELLTNTITPLEKKLSVTYK